MYSTSHSLTKALLKVISRSSQIRRASSTSMAQYESMTGFSRSEICKLEKLFKKFDEDRDDRLQLNEFNNLIRHILGRTFAAPDLHKVFDLIDEDKDGYLTFCEFLQHQAKRNCTDYPRELLIRAFNMWDKDQDGKLTLHEFRQALIYLGQDAMHKDVPCIFKVLDSDCDGLIDYGQFEQYIKCEVKKLK